MTLCGLNLARRGALRRWLPVSIAIALVASSCTGSLGDDDLSGLVSATSTPRSTATAEPEPTPTTGPLPTPTATINLNLAGTAFTNDSKVTTVGLDEVFFGMTPEQAADAASAEWVTIVEPNSSGCYTVRPSTGPDGVSFWVWNGRIERVNVSHPDIRTPSGLGVGTKQTDLEAAIGEQLQIVPNADGTSTATFFPSDAGDQEFRLVFDIADGAVSEFRSGRVGVVGLPANSCR